MIYRRFIIRGHDCRCPVREEIAGHRKMAKVKAIESEAREANPLQTNARFSLVFAAHSVV